MSKVTNNVFENAFQAELQSIVEDAIKKERQQIAATILAGGGIFQDISRNSAVITARARIAAEVLDGH